jgi:hypothetical protein
MAGHHLLTQFYPLPDELALEENGSMHSTLVGQSLSLFAGRREMAGHQRHHPSTVIIAIT